jgi:hypothetical protein
VPLRLLQGVIFGNSLEFIVVVFLGAIAFVARGDFWK